MKKYGAGQILLLCALTGALILSGCGLKYDLYLPEEEQAQSGQDFAATAADSAGQHSSDTTLTLFSNEARQD